MWGLSHCPFGYFLVGFGAGWEMLLCLLPDPHPWVWCVSFIPVPKPLTAVGWRHEGVCVREIRRSDGGTELFPSLWMASADLRAQEHFVQLGYSLIVDGATLSSACPQSLSDGKEKRQSWSLLFRLPSFSPEFIPENCTSCVIFLEECRACSSAFLHSYIGQTVMACLWWARHCARLWECDTQLEAGVYKLLWEMENSHFG